MYDVFTSVLNETCQKMLGTLLISELKNIALNMTVDNCFKCI